jgi:hypothetical protein
MCDALDRVLAAAFVFVIVLDGEHCFAFTVHLVGGKVNSATRKDSFLKTPATV